MSTIRSIAATAIASSLLLASGASAQTVSLVEHQGTWSLYADTADPKQVCFVAAQPQAVEPIGANRGPIYFYISAWPKDGIKLEPSIKAGYPVKADNDMTVTIGSDTFKLFGKGDRGLRQRSDRGIEADRIDEEGLERGGAGRFRQGHRHDRHLLAVGPCPSARQDGHCLPLAAHAPTPRAKAR